jgi:hypothetical protein
MMMPLCRLPDITFSLMPFRFSAHYSRCSMPPRYAAGCYFAGLCRLAAFAISIIFRFQDFHYDIFTSRRHFIFIISIFAITPLCLSCIHLFSMPLMLFLSPPLPLIRHAISFSPASHARDDFFAISPFRHCRFDFRHDYFLFITSIFFDSVSRLSLRRRPLDMPAEFRYSITPPPVHFAAAFFRYCFFAVFISAAYFAIILLPPSCHYSLI